MKKKLLLSLLLGLVGHAYPATAQLSVPARGSAAATPSQAYSQVASEVASLLQRATELSDEKALALLRQEGPALQARAKQVRPAYQKWLMSLSASGRKTEEQRIAATPWGKYFADSDPKLGMKISRNQALGQQVMSVMSLFEGV